MTTQGYALNGVGGGGGGGAISASLGEGEDTLDK